MANLYKHAYVCLLSTVLFSFVCCNSYASWFNTLQSETTRFTNLGAQEGLWHPVVYDIEQDANGLIWIATQDGVHRYDGKHLKLYSYSPSNPNSISSNWVWDIYLDSQNRLWFASKEGIHEYLPDVDGFRNFTSMTVPAMKGQAYRVIAEAPGGELWFGSQNSGITILDPNTLDLQTLEWEQAEANRIRDIHFGAEQEVWIATEGGGLGWRRQDDSDVSFFTTSTDTALPSDSIRSVLTDSEGRLWIGSNDKGVAVLHQDQGGLTPALSAPLALKSDITVRDIHQSRDGKIRLATNDGLYQWQPDTNQFLHQQHDRAIPDSLLSNNVNRIFEDKNGLIWVGTYTGVSRWNAALKPFIHINKANLPMLASDAISAFATREDGTLFVGTWGAGVSIISPRGAVNQGLHQGADITSLLAGDRIMSLHIDQHGKLWAGTFAGGLYRFNKDLSLDKSWQYSSEEVTAFSANKVSSILSLSDGTVFVGTYGNGLAIIHQDDHITQLGGDSHDSHYLSNSRVTSLATQDERFIWIGTAGRGVARYDRNSGEFIHLNKTDTRWGAIQTDDVYSVLVKNDEVWVATQDMGVVHLRLEESGSRYQVTHYNRASGLYSNFAYGLLQDKLKNVWVSHSRGLSKITPATGEVFNFNLTHGLQDLDFHIGAYHRSQQGDLYFGGANGFNIVDPSVLPTNAKPPSMMLVDVLANNSSIRGNIKKQDERYLLPLTYADRYLEFKFAALDYTAPELNRYQYKWMGRDDGWQPLLDEGRLNIAGLTEGEHKLVIRGSNSDGVWTQSPLQFDIYVQPPWYKTRYAYAAYVLIILMVILYQHMMHRKILSAKRIKQQELQRLVAQKTQQIEQQLTQIKQLSLTDSLTGVHNRRFLDNTMPELIARVQRNNFGELLSFVTLDIDFFKNVNDSYGHDAGDEVLKQLVNTLQRTVRTTDHIIRLGGEEFLLLCFIKDRAELSVLLKRLRLAVAETAFILPSGDRLSMTCSLGAVYSGFSGNNPDSGVNMIRLADKLMYRAKNSGRNCWWMINEAIEVHHEYNVDWLVENLEQAETSGMVSCIGSATAHQ